MATQAPGTPQPKTISTKEQLIRAATRLLDEGGPNAVTVQTVGDALGLSRTAIYRHFNDKQNLIDAVTERTFGEMEAAFTEAAAAEDAPVAALERVIREYLAFARRFPSRYRLQFADPQSRRSKSGRASGVGLEFAVIVNLVRAAQESGQIVGGDARRIARLISATTHGMADSAISRPDEEAATAEILSLLLELLSRRSAER
jgi:AcrR family transcriptional regulator